MIRRVLALLAVLGLVPVAATAQVSISADRVLLGSQPCVMRAGAAPPTGGSPCEFYLNTATGDLWQNVGGQWRDVTSHPVVVTLTANTSVTTPLLGAPVDLTLRPAGDVVLDPTGRDILPGANYYQNIGSPLRKFLTLHAAELDLETLVAQDVMSTIGGRVVIAPTSQLVVDLAPGATSITVKHNQAVVGDVLRMEGNGQVEFLRVTSGPLGPAGAYVYGVARDLDGSGANAWIAGDAVLNTGSVGKGFIDLYAVSGLLSGFGPTIVGNVRTGAAYNQIGPRWAVGNLNSVGYGTAAYGLAAGNPAGAFFYTDDTNGLVMTGPLGTRVQITPSGTALFAGDGNGVTNIDGGNIRARTITADKIAVGSLTAAEIGAGTITGDKIAANTITGDKIVAGAIVAGHIVAGNVTNLTLAASAVTYDKIAAGNVLNGNLGGSAVTYDKIADGHITNAKLAGPSVTYDKIYDGHVTNAKLGNNSVDTNKVIDGSLYGFADIVAGSIYADQIGAGQIIASKIDAYAIYGKYLNANDIYSGTVRSNAMYSNDMYSNTIRSNEVYSNNIYSNTLTSNTLNSNTLNSSAINGGTITSVTLTSNTINGGTINGTDINGVNITGVNLSAANGNVTITPGQGLSISGAGGNGEFHVGGRSIYGNCCTLVMNGDTNVSGSLNTSGTLSASGTAYFAAIQGSSLNLSGSADVNYIHVWGNYADFNGQIHAKGTSYFDSDANVGRDMVVSSQTRTSSFRITGGIPFGDRDNAQWDTGEQQFYRDTSSLRYKQNVQPWAPTDPLAILKLPLVTYDFRAQPEFNIPVQPGSLGVIAEDVFQIAPLAVRLDSQGRPDAIRRGAFEVYLLAALKAVNDKRGGEVESLQAQVRSLEERLAALEAKGRTK